MWLAVARPPQWPTAGWRAAASGAWRVRPSPGGRGWPPAARPGSGRGAETRARGRAAVALVRRRWAPAGPRPMRRPRRHRHRSRHQRRRPRAAARWVECGDARRCLQWCRQPMPCAAAAAAHGLQHASAQGPRRRWAPLALARLWQRRTCGVARRAWGASPGWAWAPPAAWAWAARLAWAWAARLAWPWLRALSLPPVGRWRRWCWRAAAAEAGACLPWARLESSAKRGRGWRLRSRC